MSDTSSRSNLAAVDAAHHLHPFADMKKLNADGARIIQRGEGVSHLRQQRQEISRWLCRPLVRQYRLWANGNRRCRHPANERTSLLQHVLRQRRRTPATLLSEKVCAHAGPHFNHVFFTNSGSEANDTWFRSGPRLLERRGQADEEDRHCPQEWLSRLHRRRRQHGAA